MFAASSIHTTSPAKIASNRRNAQKSSGPRTLEGKTRSRANAVKHGLTGAGIALPDEDEKEVEQRFATLQDELGASTVMGAILVKQIALMSVRLDRSALQETAALASRVRHAEGDFDQARKAEVDELFERIEADPVHSHRQLLRFPEGIDRLFDALSSVHRELVANRALTWEYRFGVRIEALMGRSSRDLPRPRTSILFDALYGNFRAIAKDEYAQALNGGTKHYWARQELAASIAVELAKLETARAAINPEILPLDRSEAAQRALFDPGRDASLARKYESEARRGLFRSLIEFREAERAPEPELEALQDVAETVRLAGPDSQPADHPPETPTPIEPRSVDPLDSDEEVVASSDPEAELIHKRAPIRNEPKLEAFFRPSVPDHYPERWIRVVGDDSSPRSIGGDHPPG